MTLAFGRGGARDRVAGRTPWPTAVGRSRNNTSTSGTSTPSPKTSTEKTQRSSPGLRDRRTAGARSSGGSSPVRATLGSPALGEPCAMKCACSFDTQNPRRASGTGRARSAGSPRAASAREGRHSERTLLSSSVAYPPRRQVKLLQVGPVGHTEVLERNEEALVDRLPQPKFDSDPVVEPLGDVLAVQALRRGRQPEQLARLQMVEQPVVRAARVVELVDDHDVEASGAIRRGARRSDWIVAKTCSTCRRRSAGVQLAERRRRASTARYVASDCSRISSRCATNSSVCVAADALSELRDSRARPPPSCRCRSPRRRGCGDGRGARARRSGRRASVADGDTPGRRGWRRRSSTPRRASGGRARAALAPVRHR